MLWYGSERRRVQQKQTSNSTLVSKELSQVWLMSANFVLHSDKCFPRCHILRETGFWGTSTWNLVIADVTSVTSVTVIIPML